MPATPRVGDGYRRRTPRAWSEDRATVLSLEVDELVDRGALETLEPGAVTSDLPSAGPGPIEVERGGVASYRWSGWSASGY